MFKRQKLNLLELIIFIGIYTLLFPSFGCKYTPQEITHPRKESLPNDDYFTHLFEVSRLENQSEIEIGWDIYSDTSNSKKLPIETYDYRNSQNLFFTKDELFLLNSYEYSIDRIDFEGNLIQRIGRAGRGPGEFEEVIAFTVSEDFNQIFVIDRLEIEVYTFKAESKSYEYDFTLQNIFMEAYDICHLNGNLYVSGFDINRELYNDLVKSESYTKRILELDNVNFQGPILKIDLDNKSVVIDFGYQYKSEYGFGIYEGILSQVELSCKAKNQSILAKMIYAPIIFSYNPDGSENWAIRLDGLRNKTSIEKFNPVQGVGWSKLANKGFYDMSTPFREVSNSEYLVMQFEEVKRVNKLLAQPLEERPMNFKTMLLNTNNGNLDVLESSSTYFHGYMNGVTLYSNYDLPSRQRDFRYIKNERH
ncbi:6-bladed beta-propeller [Balneola vulgaris]|uniref:6-bladed beta-propeller n=1 Tax=Balneola vulgaris TaxID=287535 RepID=UPI00037070EE|nr:6-bladed beta-propeller [Balneola vulgaris]